MSKAKTEMSQKTEQVKNKQWTQYFCCSQNTEWIGVHIFRVKRILLFVVFNNKHNIMCNNTALQVHIGDTGLLYF